MMATLVLSAAGAALGGTLSGSVLGVSAAMLGRAVGATIGNAIDQRLLGAGSQVVQTGRAGALRMMGGREGNPISRVYGRMRVTGQVIWSSRFREKSAVTGSGKGLAPPQPSVQNFSYSISFAVGLCEGEIVRVGRVWADGKLVRQKHLNMRVHRGSEAQLPDPLIEAIEGNGNAPSCRGLAYLVFEELPLADYGNRIPQISAEVFRRVGKPHVADLIQGVALVPGTGEYALATTAVHYPLGKGKNRLANVNNANGQPNFTESIRQLERELPNCRSASLVVSWFGDDLRCDRCTLKPRVEQTSADGSQPWIVAGETRGSADPVSQFDGRPVFGGTPSDASVVQAIQHLKATGKQVTFYPFLLMDIQANNALTDPWTGLDDQPVIPWRGRITLVQAPGRVGTTDLTAAAIDEVAAFFGNAESADFHPSSSDVGYSGPAEWSYRRFILHYAHLCMVAGGVDTFCLGSELRGLTQIRSGASDFPTVDALRNLAADVRTIVGAQCKLTYAADWSEYFGYHPQGRSGDVLFHLDPLWADANINFVGIDNYMPLSDWRDDSEHLDAGWRSIHNPEYLQGNIEGGEGFDWYYESDAKRALQLRSVISDGAYNEPWIYRCKDFRSWWSNGHHNRLAGIRSPEATAWIPQSKPIVFTELGCPAINNGTNQPNMFVDAKSAESGLPWNSDGGQDDLIQQSYLRAVYSYWAQDARNPVATGYVGRMVDMTRAHAWAWDTRPWPDFPARLTVWSDAENYSRGHWLNGRIGNVPLADLVTDLCAEAGLFAIDTSELFGGVKGYELSKVETGRQSLQPLMLAFAFDCFEMDGKLTFRNRRAETSTLLLPEIFVAPKDGEPAFQVTRADDANLPGRLRLGFVRADDEYQDGASELADPMVDDAAVSASELPLLLEPAESQRILERWVAEARIGRESIAMGLPPSALSLSPGDVIKIRLPDHEARFRIDRVEEAGSRQIEAVRIETGVYRQSPLTLTATGIAPAFNNSAPVYLEFLDLPDPGDFAGPFVAAAAEPWPGAIAVYSSASDQDYAVNAVVDKRSLVGTTLELLPPAGAGRWMRHALRIRIASGELESRSEGAVLNGANAALLRAAGSQDWELFQFLDAVLVAPGEYRLEGLLRGQSGTEFLSDLPTPAGADFVLLDGSAARLRVTSAQRGLPRHYRYGPASEPYDDASYGHDVWTFRDVGSRPFSPAHLKAESGNSGDLAISWIRRARLDGDSWEGLDVPNSEIREIYHVRIGGGVREFETFVPNVTYSAANQSADGINTPYIIEVAQISDRYGAGPYTRMTFNG